MQEVKIIWSCMSCLKGICSQLYEGVECRIEGQGVTVTAVCPVWMKKGMFDRGLIGAKSYDESIVDATKIIVPKTTSSLRSFLYLISGKMQRSRKYFQKLRC